MKAFVVQRAKGVTLITPYNPQFLDALKDEIAPGYRRYDPASKTWTVRDPKASEAIDLLYDYFDDVELLAPFEDAIALTAHDDRDCLRRVREGWPDCAVLNVLPGAHPAVIRAAYHALSMVCHPDAGGDHDAQVRLNAAHERLTERS